MTLFLAVTITRTPIRAPQFPDKQKLFLPIVNKSSIFFWRKRTTYEIHLGTFGSCQFSPQTNFQPHANTNYYSIQTPSRKRSRDFNKIGVWGQSWQPRLTFRLQFTQIRLGLAGHRHVTGYLGTPIWLLLEAHQWWWRADSTRTIFCLKTTTY